MDQNKQEVIDALNKLIKIDEQHKSNYATTLLILEATRTSISTYSACSSFMHAIKQRVNDWKTISLINVVIDYLDATLTVFALTEQEPPRFINAKAPTKSISYISMNDSIHPNFNKAHSSAYSMKNFIDGQKGGRKNVNF
jgi:hypothetical protein